MRISSNLAAYLRESLLVLQECFMIRLRENIQKHFAFIKVSSLTVLSSFVTILRHCFLKTLILRSQVLSNSASSFFKFCVTSQRLSKDISTVISSTNSADAGIPSSSRRIVSLSLSFSIWKFKASTEYSH